MITFYTGAYGGNGMKVTLRLKEAIRERGLTLSSIAKKLGIHRSNMSAIASGSRGVSLRMLKQISHILDCGMDELFGQKKYSPIFKDKNSQSALNDIEKANFDGIDKSWVNRVMFAQHMHYKNIRKA